MRTLLYHQSSKQIACLSQLFKIHPPQYTVLGVVARTFHSGTSVTKVGDHELKTTLVYIARSTGENENPKHYSRLFNALWVNHLEQHTPSCGSPCCSKRQWICHFIQDEEKSGNCIDL